MAPKRSSKQASGLNQTRLKSANSGKHVGKQAITSTPALRKNDSSTSLSSLERTSPPTEEVKKPVAKKETIDLTAKEKKDERPVLHPNSKEWNKLHAEAKAEMGGLPPIHGEGVTKVQVFDMTSKYGPCAGISRLERWERAKKWGLDPPEQIKTILLTKQGEDEDQYRESVLYGWV